MIRNIIFICDALCGLVTFIHFEKLDKHPWWNLTFSKVVSIVLFILSSI